MNKTKKIILSLFLLIIPNSSFATSLDSLQGIFNGSDYIMINDSDDFSLGEEDFAFSVIVNLSHSEPSAIVSKYDYGIPDTHFLVTASTVSFNVYEDGVSALTYSPINLNTDHLITVIYKDVAQTLSLYVDGSLVDIRINTTVSLRNTANPVVIGGLNWSSPPIANNYKGTMKDLIMTKGSLTIEDEQKLIMGDTSIDETKKIFHFFPTLQTSYNSEDITDSIDNLNTTINDHVNNSSISFYTAFKFQLISFSLFSGICFYFLIKKI